MFFPVPCAHTARRTLTRATFFLTLACIGVLYSVAQSAPDNTDIIAGVVLNSVSREPIPRALVYSPDNHFATLSNNEGRFEFALPRADSASANSSRDSRLLASGIQANFARPDMLMARKPGYITDPENPGLNLQSDVSSDLTLTLVPESLIVGTVTVPSSEPPDTITLQIFRRQVQDGRAQWVPAGGAQSTSDGEFRFAELRAGTYKLLTHEQLERDPLTVDALDLNAPTPARRGPLVGYPPVYYQSASDFGSATTIQLNPGQTQTVDLTLTKQPYYWVKVPVNSSPEIGIRVSVSSPGHKGPGYSLGYNANDHAIEGLLPNGTYTIEASSVGANGVSGVQSITVKGAPIEGPGLILAPNPSIPIIVKEEFTSADHTGPLTWSVNRRSVVMKGPRRYLNVMLQPVDEVGFGQTVSMRDPVGSGDEGLSFEGAPAGVYWVQVHSSRGYPASVRSGNLDLQRQPLVVGAGGGASPIEITMRDDSAEISGTVTGITRPLSSSTSPGGDGAGMTSYSSLGQARAVIYCVPVSDSTGQFTRIAVNPDGTFTSYGLPPGAYRLLAFDHDYRDLEYLNSESMQGYDAQGLVVRLAAGQQENVQLQLISARSLINQP